jgi:hypothetical protein
MTGPSDEPDGDESKGDVVDLDELRPPSGTTDPVQDPVDLSEVRTESSGGPESDSRSPLDEPRPPSSTMDPVQDPIEPEWRESDEAVSDGDDSESNVDECVGGADGDGV